jgi:hypothetical protein
LLAVEAEVAVVTVAASAVVDFTAAGAFTVAASAVVDSAAGAFMVAASAVVDFAAAAFTVMGFTALGFAAAGFAETGFTMATSMIGSSLATLETRSFTIPIHTTDTIPTATILTIIIRMAMAIILTAMGTAAFAILIFTGVAFMAVVFTAMAFMAVSLTADVTDTNNSVEQRLGEPIRIKMA